MIDSLFRLRFVLQPASRSQNVAAGVDSKGVLGSEPQSPRLRES